MLLAHRFTRFFLKKWWFFIGFTGNSTRSRARGDRSNAELLPLSRLDRRREEPDQKKWLKKHNFLCFF